ncbi:discoidin domain-containing protein [Paenibacillus gorillae]|uniref:discoidin domain-containing protein n=1 Tax=Paenibacillus gorillae TaxID=1243662 RepID=UPI0004B33CC1|nr:discoidin domain-containing protein [Paenibacillus gorillae]
MKRKFICFILCFVLLVSSTVSSVSASDFQQGQDAQEMEGASPPEGTIISGVSFPGTPAENAIDGNLLSYWSSGSSLGTLELLFPEPTKISGVQLAAYASPTSTEEFEIYGLNQGNWIEVSDTTTHDVSGDSSFTPTILNTITILPGNYDGIRIEVNTNSSSWVAISEIRFIQLEVCNGIPGFKFPETTTISGVSYSGHTADIAVDCNLETYWNSGGIGGQVELLFPSPLTIGAIQIASHASPAENINYIIYGLIEGEWIRISNPISLFSNSNYRLPTIQEPIPVAQDSYDGIRIKVTGRTSWAALNEITYFPTYLGDQVTDFIRNIVPQMSSNNSAYGRIQYSSKLQEGYLSFDRVSDANGWAPLSSQNEWISYEFSNPKVITKYSIIPINHPVGPARAPKDWKFEAFDGTQWITLDSRTGITDWQPGQAKYFNINNTSAYQAYRLYIVKNNGDTYISIGEIEMEQSKVIPSIDSPNSLNATQIDNNIVMSWRKTKNSIGYNVYQNGVKVNNIPIQDINYTFSGLVNGVTYKLAVTAIFPNGESSKSTISYTLTGPSQSLIPPMMSNNSPQGLVEFSSALNGSTSGYIAFDRLYNQFGWAPTSTQNEWLSYQFSSPRTVTKYTIRTIDHNTGPERAPKDWIFQGFNGNEWVTLDTQVGITDWVQNESKLFTVDNQNSYSKYRIFITKNNGGQYLQINELEMIGD